MQGWGSPAPKAPLVRGGSSLSPLNPLPEPRPCLLLKGVPLLCPCMCNLNRADSEPRQGKGDQLPRGRAVFSLVVRTSDHFSLQKL